jgi:hypothetical protein
MSDGSEYVSGHDRGAFGKLLAEAKALGAYSVSFDVLLHADPEDQYRWAAYTVDPDPRTDSPLWSGPTGHEFGRTGEEALRRLVEKLRG